MNRKQRRQADKMAKKKFSPEDYKKFKDGLIAEAAALQAKQTFGIMVEKFVLAMRKNRISEERINKIIDDFQEMSKQEREE